MELEHPEEVHKFSMKVVSVRKSPLVRQCEEGLLIGSFKGDLVLNRKGEWGNNLHPAMTMEDNGPKQKAEGHRGRLIKRMRQEIDEHLGQQLETVAETQIGPPDQTEEEEPLVPQGQGQEPHPVREVATEMQVRKKKSV